MMEKKTDFYSSSFFVCVGGGVGRDGWVWGRSEVDVSAYVCHSSSRFRNAGLGFRNTCATPHQAGHVMGVVRLETND